MGKNGKKKSQMLVPTEEPGSGDQRVLPTQNSPFTSSIISVRVGEPGELFKIHRNLLSQSAVFQPLIQNQMSSTGFPFPQSYDTAIEVPNVAAPIFDLVVRYLYGNPFECWHHALTVEVDNEAANVDMLRPACELFCFALKYGFAELKEMIASHIRDLPFVNYQSILAAGKFVYNNATCIEPWFREFLLSATREALANPDVADEPWFVEIFEGGHNGLSKDMFACYRDFQRLCLIHAREKVSEKVLEPEPDSSVKLEDSISSGHACQTLSCVDVVDARVTGAEGRDWIELSPECSSRENELLCETPVESPNYIEPDYPEPEQLRDADLVYPEPEIAEVPGQFHPEPELYAEEPAAEEPACTDGPAYIDRQSSEDVHPEPTVETSEYRSYCSMRRHHLRKMSRWVQCTACQKEVVAMAKKAAAREADL